MKQGKKALLVIDVQYDYFEDGLFPLWNMQNTMENIKNLISNIKDAEVVLIRHVSDLSAGPAPFFIPESKGVEIHEEILKVAKDKKLITKSQADAFFDPELEKYLQNLGIEEIFICGMMTQHCVTHTALSKSAEKFKKVSVVSDCCTTVNEALHQIGLHGLSSRVNLVVAKDLY